MKDVDLTRIVSGHRLLAGAVVAAATAAIAVGVNAYAGTGSGKVAGQFSPRLGAVPLIQGTGSDVVSTLASRLPLVSNAATVPETVPAAPGSSGIAVSGLKVTCDLAVDSIHDSGITKALWERDLFMGAVRDEFAAQGFGNVIDGSSTLVTPDGSRYPDGGGVSYGVPTNQVFDAVPASMSSTVESAASALGFQSVQTSTMQVLQDAVLITAVSDSPAADVSAYRQKGGLQYLLGQSPTNFEGVYFEVDDTAGNPVYIADTAPRDGGGGWWADPSIGIQGDYHPVPSTTG
jgi:hypothetical protein